MFTGLIDHCGKILSTEKQDDTSQMRIETGFTDLVLGESIAVNGICLTVTAFSAGQFHCDISSETLAVTNAGEFQPDMQVNLERAMLASSRFGGHFVLGHVDQVAQVAERNQLSDYLYLRLSNIPVELMKYIVPKGSIAVNGVSLTINELFNDGFSVMLVPHTLSRTNLINLQPGERVNLEFDYLVKAVVHAAPIIGEKNE